MRRKKKPKAVPPAEFNPPKVLKYLGNRETRELHLMAWAGGGCQLSEVRDREEFADFQEAVAAGYKECSFCLHLVGSGEVPASRD